MGSTSEPYQNGTNVQNVVVYVANENVQSIQQQQQQQQYLSSSICSTEIYISNNNDRLVYSQCAQYRSPSVTLIDDSNISVKGILKAPEFLHNISVDSNVYNISSQNGSHDAAVFISNANKMYENTTQTVYKEHVKPTDDEKFQSDDGKQTNAIISNCCTSIDNEQSTLQLPPSNETNLKSNDIVVNIPNFTAAAATGLLIAGRSDSVRVGDSFTSSGCSSNSVSSFEDGASDCTGDDQNTNTSSDNNKETFKNNSSTHFSDDSYVRVSNTSNVLNNAVKKVPSSQIKRIPFVSKIIPSQPSIAAVSRLSNTCNNISETEAISIVRTSSPLNTVSVPVGWKRLNSNGAIIYVSPSNTALTSLDRVKSYLLTEGTCKCGLECPVQCDIVFNFDPKVATRPYIGTPCSNSSAAAHPGDLTKLCNHKRKSTESWPSPFQGGHSQNQIQGHDQSQGSFVTNSNCLSSPNIAYDPQPHQQPLLSPSQPHQAPSPLPNSAIASRQLSNHCKSAVVKNYAFDVSDRKKKRKMPQPYSDINAPPVSPQSPHVMVYNPCEISAKENNSPSLISQSSSSAYPGRMDMVNIIGQQQQQMNMQMGSAPPIRMKQQATFVHSGYQNQNYFNAAGVGVANSSANYNYSNNNNSCYQQQNNCSDHRAILPDTSINASNVYMHSSENYSTTAPGPPPQMTNNFVCNQIKTSAGGQLVQQQSCNNVMLNQQHRLAFGIPTQQPQHATISISTNGNTVNGNRLASCSMSENIPTTVAAGFTQQSQQQLQQFQQHQMMHVAPPGANFPAHHHHHLPMQNLINHTSPPNPSVHHAALPSVNGMEVPSSPQLNSSPEMTIHPPSQQQSFVSNNDTGLYHDHHHHLQHHHHHIHNVQEQHQQNSANCSVKISPASNSCRMNEDSSVYCDCYQNNNNNNNNNSNNNNNNNNNNNSSNSNNNSSNNSNSSSSSSSSSNSSATNNKLNNLTPSPCNDRAECTNYSCSPSAASVMVPASASQNHMLIQHNDQQPFIVQDHQNSMIQSQQQFQQQHPMIPQQTAQLHPNAVHIQQSHQQQHYQLQQHMQQQHQLQHDIMHQNLEMKNKNQMLQQSTHIVQHPSAIQVQSLPSALENVEEMQRSNEFLISSQQQQQQPQQQHSQHNINVSPAANVHHYQRSSSHVWQQQNRINNGNINDNNHNVVTTASSNVIVPSVASASSNDSPSPVSSPYERVPPLHPHVSPGPASWNDEPPRKKYNRTTSKSPTTASALRKPRSPYNNSNSNSNNCIGSSNNINDLNRNSNHALQHINPKLSSLSDSHNNEYVSHVVPSFMDDPNGYLAQQTALLNSTISKQTGVSLCTSNERNANIQQQYKYSYNNSSANSNVNSSNNNNSNRPAIVPCSSSAVASSHNKDDGVQYGISGAAASSSSRKIYSNNSECRLQSRTPDSSVNSDYSQRQMAQQQQSVGTSTTTGASKAYASSNFPSSSEKSFVSPDGSPVTSSTYTDSRDYNPASVSSSDSRSPIQAGTVSTSNQSPVQPGISSPNICSGGPSSVNSESYSSYPATPVMQESTLISAAGSPKPQEMVPYHAVVTTMASGHTYSSNTITSVLAGKTNTALVTVNNSNDIDNSGTNANHTNIDSSNNVNNDTIVDVATVKENNALTDAKGSGNNGNNKTNIGNNTISSAGVNKNVTGNSIIINNASSDSGNGSINKCANIRAQFVSSPLPNSNEIISSKSPLEMVQNVVSSIQIPQQQQQQHPDSVHSSQKTQLNTQNLQGSHILVSSNGQLIVATSNTVASQNIAKVHTSIPLIHSSATSSSSIVTNVTGSQMIPTMGVAQQVLGQPTVVVNTLPNGQLVFHQPSVMTAVDGTTTVQIPQLAVAATAGNVTSQNLTENNNATTVTLNTGSAGQFSPRNQNNLAAANALDPSKRKINSGRKRKLSPHLLQISQPVSGTASVVVQQQPHTQTSFTQPHQMLQTLTILPNKNTAQFTGAQPLIATANVLQPINFVQNVPTIQQFIVPAGLGGMVMATGDGTATLLPDAVQLNVLTPVQNPTFGHTGGQSIITTGPAAGMVIRTQPSNPQNTLTAQLRPQAISTATGQFITAQSPNQFIVNNSNFSGQLSPIVASVSPNQPIHSFSASPNNNNSSMNTVRSNSSQPQEFIHCGPALVVPCSVSQTSSPQNTTVVQQNTTIVQQQMTMVSNNQQLPDQSSSNHSANGNNNSGAAGNVISSNLTPHNIILNDSKQSQNFIITTDNKSPSAHHPQTSYILSSPKSSSADKPNATSAGTHFILNNLNGEKQTQSFIISSSPSNGNEKQLCGNFILTTNSSEKTSSGGNFIIASSPSTAQNTRFTRQSVSTQTAAAAAAAGNPQVLQISSTPTLFVAAANNNNTFSTSATTTAYIGSPPDTTTHSPINSSSGQSPDTPSSSSLLVGSTDDVSSSPTSSTPNMPCSNDNMQTRQPMVHCISSSNVVDWTDGNGIEEKKLKIIVDHGTPEIIAAGMDVFSPIASLQARYERQKYDFSSTSLDGKESISFIESSTFEESTIHK